MPKHAANDKEADDKLREYCESIGFDPEWITPDDWATTIRIACDKDKGIELACGTIEEDRTAIVKAGASASRRARVDGDTAGLIAALDVHWELKDSLVLPIIRQMRLAYIGGERINLELSGKPMHNSAYAELRQEWRKVAALATGGAYTNFHDYPPQDKAAAGKGNVGGTIAKRKVQGDLLANVCGVKFNMHCNISD